MVNRRHQLPHQHPEPSSAPRQWAGSQHRSRLWLPRVEISAAAYGSVASFHLEALGGQGRGRAHSCSHSAVGIVQSVIYRARWAGAEAPPGREPSLVGLPALGRMPRWSLYRVGWCHLGKLKDTSILIVHLAGVWRGYLYLMSRFKKTPIPCAEQPQELNID